MFISYVAGDGMLDLSEANNGSYPSYASTVSMLLGNGDGTFHPAQTFGAGSGAVSVAVGDVNGDGRPDLAVANNYSNDVSVLLGNGDGTFQPARSYGAGTNPLSVAVGGVNERGGGKLGLAYSSFIDDSRL